MSQNNIETTNYPILLSMLPPPKARKQKQLNILQKYLLTHSLFQKVRQRNGTGALQQIVSNLVVKNYEPQQIIYKLPQDLRTFNFLIVGVVHLFSDTDSKLQHRVISNKNIGQLALYQRIYPGEYFGDKVFTTGRKSQIVCAKAIQKTMVIQLNLIVLHKSFQGIFAFKQLQLIIQLLRNVPVFSKIPSKKIERILENSRRVRYRKGHVLFQQGNQPQNMLVILQGQIILRKRVQFPYGQDQIASRNFDLSILGKFDTLGVQQILQEHNYFSTAICKSDSIQLLSVDKQISKSILMPYSLSRLLDKNKQLWRKRRVNQLQTTISKNNFSPSLDLKDVKKSISIDSIRFTLEDRQKLSYIQDRHKSSLQKNNRHRFSLSDCRRTSSHKKFQQTSLRNQQHRDPSVQIRQRYLLKKSRKQLIQTKKYQHLCSQNPQQTSLVKPFFVRQSQAIKNTMRQIKHSRKHIYNYMLKLTQSFS